MDWDCPFSRQPACSMERAILLLEGYGVKFCCLIILASAVKVAAAPIGISNFELPDQHNQLRAYHFPAPKLTLMAITDSKGCSQLEPWISQLYQQFGETINIDGIADLSSVPDGLRSAVRFIFQKQLSRSVLLDWNGSVVRQFQYEPGKANLYVLNRRGYIAKHVSGSISQPALHHLSQAIQDELAR
jgi:hypothetical protein